MCVSTLRALVATSTQFPAAMVASMLQALTEEAFLRHKLLVHSRSLTVTSSKLERSVQGLIPVADLLNHNNLAGAAFVWTDESRIDLLATQTFRAGTHVEWPYASQMCREQMMLVFGFAVPEAPVKCS